MIVNFLKIVFSLYLVLSVIILFTYAFHLLPCVARVTTLVIKQIETDILKSLHILYKFSLVNKIGNKSQ